MSEAQPTGRPKGRTRRWQTFGLLILVLLAVGVLIYREAMRGPTFRASDYATFDECMRNIPRDWMPGSIEHTRSEAACHYEQQRRARGLQ